MTQSEAKSHLKRVLQKYVKMASNQSGVSRRPKQELPDDLSNVEFETSEDVEVIPSFDSLGLREDLLRGIYAYGMNDSNIALFSAFFQMTQSFTSFV